MTQFAQLRSGEAPWRLSLGESRRRFAETEGPSDAWMKKMFGILWQTDEKTPKTRSKKIKKGKKTQHIVEKGDDPCSLVNMTSDFLCTEDPEGSAKYDSFCNDSEVGCHPSST